MKKANLFVLLFGLLSCCPNSFSQRNFQPGYVITLEGDTIHGLIDYRQWNKNPDFIDFKSASEGMIIPYSPLQIKSFLVTGENFVGMRYPVTLSPGSLKDLSDTLSVSVMVGPVFLSLLVDGSLSLYYLKDKESDLHFFSEKEGEDLQELVRMKYVKKAQQGTLEYTDNLYRKTLNESMGNIPACKQGIEKLKYNAKSLTDIFVLYNSCRDSLKKVYPRKDKILISPFIIAGIVRPIYNFKPDDLSDNGTVSDFIPDYPDLSFTCGLGLNLISSRHLQRFSVYNEFIYHAIQYDISYREEERPNLYNLVHRKADLHYIKYSLIPRYQPLVNNWRPFIEAGLSIGLKIGGEMTKVWERHFYDQINYFNTTDENIIFALPEIGLGCYHNKGWAVECRYNLKAASLLVGYNFANKY